MASSSGSPPGCRSTASRRSQASSSAASTPPSTSNSRAWPSPTRPTPTRLRALQGKAAIANAKLAYRLFTASFSGSRWGALAARGARVQRPLWASTSTKNPAYRDVIYVEELIGPDTVNTLPPATLEAFRDHGEVRQSVAADLGAAERALASLEAAGVSIQAVTDRLLVEGLASFEQSFVTLLAGLARKRAALASVSPAGASVVASH